MEAIELDNLSNYRRGPMPNQRVGGCTYELFMTFLLRVELDPFPGRSQTEWCNQAARKYTTCAAEIVQPAMTQGQLGALIWGLSTSYEGRSVSFFTLTRYGTTA